QTFPDAARALAKLPASELALDGIVVTMDERGAPSFEALRTHVARGAAVSGAVLIAWDLLSIDGEDLRTRPLADRRRRLAALLASAPSGIVASQALDGELARVLAVAGKLGLRGVVARRLTDGYDGAWHCYSASAEPVDWRRHLSPPPPLSNADKVLYPRDGIAKQEIVAYYRDVAPVMLRYLLDRPVVIQRWPDGIDEFAWYQHRVPPKAPDYLRAAWVDGVRRCVIDNADALLWMANQAGLTYHTFASRLAAFEEPNWAMIDLDPGDATTWWADTIEVALAVRRTLELLELPSVVKTSGNRGLHILVPLGPGHTFAEAEELGARIADLLLRLMPDKLTLENEKEKRRGRLLFDIKQFLAKTLVAPYSLRACDAAPVSTPITWDEVTPALAPTSFNLRTVRQRLEARGDLAAPLLDGRAELAGALAKLRGE
ncbi:MAG TPA: non-homologous end-joining DNA ligase, partial [Kofleriaceae bacterium]|nr:non-homologous end-joining DNA ligase [Kofleriaceae bacterium]